MKVILSRKGFDSANGGIPNPIMPDGTLLSMPIPSDDSMTYADFAYNGLSYIKLLKQLRPSKEYTNCHLDPDIRNDIWLNLPSDWQPAFGQVDAAQGQLRNQGVGGDDLFLFFGWFREVEQLIGGDYQYVKGAPDIHAIYGYLQVDSVITHPYDVAKYWWHPHSLESRVNKKTNALYLARKTLSFDHSKPGCGVLSFNEKHVLTLKDYPKGTWKENPAYMPSNIVTNRKNDAGRHGVYYKGIWQELVLKENDVSESWAKSILF